MLGVSPPLVAVTPLVLAPLTLLGLLFPALLAKPLALVRRWCVFLNVGTLCSALYVARFTFQGVRRRLEREPSWWADPAAFWGGAALVAAAGAAWVWRRGRAATAPDQVAAPKPWLSEHLVVGLVSLLGLAAVAHAFWAGEPVLHPSLVIWAVAWAGSLYMAYLRWAAGRLPTDRPALPAQGAMLVALALACAVYGGGGLLAKSASE